MMLFFLFFPVRACVCVCVCQAYLSSVNESVRKSSSLWCVSYLSFAAFGRRD